MHRFISSAGRWLSAISLISLFASLPQYEVRGNEESNRTAARTEFEKAMETFYHNHDLTELRQELIKVTGIDPTYPQAHFNLAIVAAGEHDWNGSVQEFQKAIDFGSGTDLQEKARREINLIKSHQEMWKTTDGQKQVLYDESLAKARAFLAANRPGDAVAETETAIQVNPAGFDAYSVQAAAFAAAQQYDNAEEALEKASKVVPEDKKEVFEKAKADLNIARKFDQAWSSASQFLGSGDYKGAAAKYLEAWELNRPREDCRLRAAMAFTLAQNWTEAESILNELTSSKNLVVAQQATSQLSIIRSLQQSNGSENSDNLLKEQERLMSEAQTEGDRMKAAAEQQHSVAEQASAEMDQIKAENAARQAKLDISIGIFSKGIDDKALAAVRQALSTGQQITSIGFGPNGSWVLVTAQNVSWNSISDDLIAAIRQQLGNKIRQVALGPNGIWAVIFGTNGSSTSGSLPQKLSEALKEVNKNQEIIGELAFTTGGGWDFVRGTSGYYCQGVPMPMFNKLKEFSNANETITHVAISPSGGWVLVRGDYGFWQAEVPKEMADALWSIYGAKAKISSVAFAPDGGWLLTFNPVQNLQLVSAPAATPVPTPAPAPSSTGNALNEAEQSLNSVYRQLWSQLNNSQRATLKAEEIQWINMKERIPITDPRRLQVVRDRISYLQSWKQSH